jgi:hypothetical protein
VHNILSSCFLYINIKIKEYGILPLVLYGCGTWSLTLREELMLRVFENRVLRRIFGLKWDEVTEEWRKLHNEELQDLYCSPNIFRLIKSRRMRLAGHVARMGNRRGVYRILVGNQRERDHLEDTGVDMSIIFGKWDDGVWTGSTGSG